MESSAESFEEAHRALALFTDSAWDIQPLEKGLINQTYVVTNRDHGRLILQRVNPIFPEAVHETIRAVTEHLARRGLITPRLFRNTEGLWFAKMGDNIWRLMTFIEGRNLDRLNPASAFEAGRMLGSFHRALGDLEHDFQGMRTGVHDTALHLKRLELAVATHGGHDYRPQVEELARAIERAQRDLVPLTCLRRRVGHGDPKLSNLLFSLTDPPRAIAFVDLDTLGPTLLAHELGDAWRSWCNLRDEDESVSNFAIDIYQASLGGYATEMREIEPEEVESLLSGVEWISLELAARFAADTLEERYFGWDKRRFGRASEHNLRRALGQVHLHRSLIENRGVRERLLREAFAR